MRNFLICDDHALVREALVGTVQMSWPDAAITQAGDFLTAWEAARAEPDLCIADLVMPGAAPLEGIDGIMRASPRTQVLVVTGTEDDALLLALLRRGVAGFAPKSASGNIIEAAIRLILAGGRYLPPRLADIAASQVDAPGAMQPTVAAHSALHAGMHSAMPLATHTTAAPSPHGQTAEPATTPGELTARQVDVLRLASQGQSNKEIARTLGLAPSTVKTHLENLLSILGASNRIEASNKARDLKLL